MGVVGKTPPVPLLGQLMDNDSIATDSSLDSPPTLDAGCTPHTLPRQVVVVAGPESNAMTQQLVDLVEPVFVSTSSNSVAKRKEGCKSYRWVLEQFLIFVRSRHGGWPRH